MSSAAVAGQLDTTESRAEKSEDARRTATRLPKLIRQITALQDSIARGSTTALAAKPILARRVASMLTDLDKTGLAEPSTANALLTFALSGADPRVIRAVLDGAVLAPPFDRLLPGALAYLEGRRNDAVRHFSAVETANLGDVAKGPVHLALAALRVENNPTAALKHLDQARIALPGTLVEEAALRRAVLITAEQNDAKQFERLAGRYLRKFRTSIYAGNFRKRLSAALTRMQFLDEPDGFARLNRILEPMSAAGKRELYLALARSAVENGRTMIAARSAAMAAADVEPGSLDDTRARLYAAAAEVVDPLVGDEALSALEVLDPIQLPVQDRPLRRAAIELGDAVAAPPQPEEQRAMVGSDTLSIDEFRRNSIDIGVGALLETNIEGRVIETLIEIDALLRASP
ncbi:MAG: chemotaxis protein MotC [Pseudomonadota bacterium]